MAWCGQLLSQHSSLRTCLMPAWNSAKSSRWNAAACVAADVKLHGSFLQRAKMFGAPGADVCQAPLQHGPLHSAHVQGRRLQEYACIDLQ